MGEEWIEWIIMSNMLQKLKILLWIYFWHFCPQNKFPARIRLPSCDKLFDWNSWCRLLRGSYKLFAHNMNTCHAHGMIIKQCPASGSFLHVFLFDDSMQVWTKYRLLPLCHKKNHGPKFCMYSTSKPCWAQSRFLRMQKCSSKLCRWVGIL